MTMIVIKEVVKKLIIIHIYLPFAYNGVLFMKCVFISMKLIEKHYLFVKAYLFFQ